MTELNRRYYLNGPGDDDWNDDHQTSGSYD